MKKIETIIIDEIIEKYENEYISLLCKERMLPDIKDGLRAVQRRIIWAIYNLLKSKNKLIKSANVVGETIKFHPHGDQSIYGSLITMINETENKIIYGKGNWGNSKSITPSKAAAMRYTECKLGDFFNDYFRYINLSYLVLGEAGNNEPSFIPVPIPYSLIYGFYGIVKQIGVCSIFPFKFEDLMIRLYRLLSEKYFKKELKLYKNLQEYLNKYDEYPLPNMNGLKTKVEDIKLIFEKGIGKIKVFPKLLYKREKNIIEILDVYKDINLSTFISFLEKQNIPGGISIRDLSRRNQLKIEIKFKRKFDKIEDFYKIIKNKLTADLKYNILVYKDEKENAIQIGIDKWLLYTFNIYLNFHKMNIKNGIEKLEKRLAKFMLIKMIRPELEKFMKENKKITKTKLEKFKKHLIKKFSSNQKEISELLSTTTILNLLSTDIDIPGLEKEIKLMNKKMEIKNMLKDTFSFYLK